MPQPGISPQSLRARADKLCVTKPRCVLSDSVYLLTRRCSERRFFLLPEPAVTLVFEYLLGLLSKQYGIQIHAYVVMSNHYHLVVTDTEGRLPDFQRDLNSLLARAINRHWGRREAFWDRESYSGVKLLEDQDVISKMAYTLANPVKARLVNRANEWNGATSAKMVFGRSLRIPRPNKFFRKSMPEAVELVLTRPACFEGLSDAEVLELVRADVARREAEHRQLGKATPTKREWWECPESFDPRRQVKPTVAACNKWARIEALRRSKEWLTAYYDALRRFVGGEREVEFPRGTWQMCARLRCPVAVA
jgi:REP element-mobilizing transposase RayT